MEQPYRAGHQLVLLAHAMDFPSPKNKRVNEPDEQQTQMVKLRSDTFEALVSLDQINQHPDSFLATMVQLEVERCGLAGLEQIPTVRWDCDPAVTKEVVEVLRQVCEVLKPLPADVSSGYKVDLVTCKTPCMHNRKEAQEPAAKCAAHACWGVPNCMLRHSAW